MPNKSVATVVATILLLTVPFTCPFRASKPQCTSEQAKSWKISRDWFEKKVTIAEAEQMDIYKKDINGTILEKSWNTIKSEYKEGDELWYYASVFETKGKKNKIYGFVLLRDCAIVKSVQAMILGN